MMIGSILLAAFTLVGADKSAKVVIPENAEPSTRLAVTELTNYVAKISGEILKVEKVGGGGQWNCRNSFVVGTLDTLGAAVPAAVRKALDARKEIEAFWCGTADGNIWIVGKYDTGDLRGVYWFLERKLGVRWFKAETPDDPGDYVPQSKTLEIGDFAECRAPRFPVRRLDQTGSNGWVIPRRGMTHACRLGFQVVPGHGGRVPYEKPDSPMGAFFGPRLPRLLQEQGGGHNTIVCAIPKDKFFDTHPEYFALVDGKRRKDDFYCLTNPDVARLTAEHIIACYKTDGGHGRFHFGQTDAVHGFCQCDRCRAASQGAKATDISRVFGLFVKDVAARVWAVCPEADLSLWVYSAYRHYTGIEQDPRMKLWFCTHGRCHAHALDDPNCLDNAESLKEIERWHAPGREIFFYDYLTCAPNLYTCNEAVEAHDIRFYDKMGYIGWKNEAPYTDADYMRKGALPPDNFPSNWQWLYVTGHLLWDPNEDWEALLADAESKYYGPAYPAMKKYHAERRRLWAKPGPCMGYPRGDSHRPLLLSEKGAKERLLGFLAEAEKLVDDTEESNRHCPPIFSTYSLKVFKRRLALDRKWLTEYWIKPNDRIQEEEARAVKLSETKNPQITIDGVGDEPAWKNAVSLTEFESVTHGANKKGWMMKGVLATEVKVLRDDKNFYLLCTAKEPTPEKMRLHEGHDSDVWEDDHFEFMFAPPVIDCRYYQVCVNAKGSVFDASWPGCKAADTFGVEAKGKILADRWVVELRIPTEKMHEFIPGEKWRILFGRLRAILDKDLPHHWNNTCSIGGCGFHDTAGFTPVEIVK